MGVLACRDRYGGCKNGCNDMASIRRSPNSPFWLACFRNSDGIRTNRTTKLTDRHKAMKLAIEWEDAARKARTGQMVEGAVLKTFNDILQRVGAEPLHGESVETYLRNW